MLALPSFELRRRFVSLPRKSSSVNEFSASLPPMAFRLATLKRVGSSPGSMSELGRWVHSAALLPPMADSIGRPATSPHFVLPEGDQIPDRNNGNDVGYGFPGFSIGGSMELMAVPKKKVSKHKRGIRNGPKALKPTPVIIRCRSCGRVKLPHFYCCSGERGRTEEGSDTLG